jgi:predicted AAA+ superfamily ATPase
LRLHSTSHIAAASAGHAEGGGTQVIAKLEQLIGEIGDLNSKLILLVGPSRSGKTSLTP